MAEDEPRRDGPERDWLSPGRPAPDRPGKSGGGDGDGGRERTRDRAEGSGHGGGDRDGPRREGEDRGRRRNDDGPADEGRGKGQEEPKPRTPWWPFVLAGIVVLAFVGLVLWLIVRPRPDVWTDDAYVQVHYATVAPRVSGQVMSVAVDDNQLVKAGDLLATLDPRDYETAVASAEAAVERDTAQVGDVSANTARQPALIDEQQAAVDSARARLAFAEADARRFANLAATGAGSNQQRQQAETALAQDRAELASALASLEAARKQLEVLAAQRKASEAAVAADRARLAQARLDLGYTRIVAPLDGMVGQRSVQTGNDVGPGATLMTLVPLDAVYIDANYREVDLLHVRSGQPVTIHVDAYDIDLDGTVDSVPPATGASFAPIQPNNATGNFTKIVQRLAVKVVVRPDQPLARLLRVGFSVETTIHTGLEDVVGDQRATARRVTAH